MISRVASISMVSASLRPGFSRSFRSTWPCIDDSSIRLLIIKITPLREDFVVLVLKSDRDVALRIDDGTFESSISCKRMEHRVEGHWCFYLLNRAIGTHDIFCYILEKNNIRNTRAIIHPVRRVAEEIWNTLNDTRLIDTEVTSCLASIEGNRVVYKNVLEHIHKPTIMVIIRRCWKTSTYLHTIAIDAYRID